jgi:hypothetical protein
VSGARLTVPPTDELPPRGIGGAPAPVVSEYVALMRWVLGCCGGLVGGWWEGCLFALAVCVFAMSSAIQNWLDSVTW